MLELDWSLVLQRLIKFLLNGFAVAICAKFLLKQAKLEEIIILGIVSASVFAILSIFGGEDIYQTARAGAGFKLGWSLVG